MLHSIYPFEHVSGSHKSNPDGYVHDVFRLRHDETHRSQSSLFFRYVTPKSSKPSKILIVLSHLKSNKKYQSQQAGTHFSHWKLWDIKPFFVQGPKNCIPCVIFLCNPLEPCQSQSTIQRLLQLVSECFYYSEVRASAMVFVYNNIMSHCWKTASLDNFLLVWAL